MHCIYSFYCSKHSGLITFFVEEFLTSHASVNKDDITKLEREIANTLDMKANSRPTTSLFNDQEQTRSNGNGHSEEPVSIVCHSHVHFTI